MLSGKHLLYRSDTRLLLVCIMLTRTDQPTVSRRRADARHQWYRRWTPVVSGVRTHTICRRNESDLSWKKRFSTKGQPKPADKIRDCHSPDNDESPVKWNLRIEAMTAKVYRIAVIETYLVTWLSAVPHYANNRKTSCKGTVRSLRRAAKQSNKYTKIIYFIKHPLLFLYHSHEWSGRLYLGKPPASSRFLPCFQFINPTETKRFTETFCKFAHQ